MTARLLSLRLSLTMLIDFVQSAMETHVSGMGRDGLHIILNVVTLLVCIAVAMELAYCLHWHLLVFGIPDSLLVDFLLSLSLSVPDIPFLPRAELIKE